MSDSNFEAEIMAFKEKSVKKIIKMRKEAQKELASGVIGDTPKDTGRATMNWIVNKGSPAMFSMHLAVGPDNPVAKAQANAFAMKPVRGTVFGEDGTLYLTNNVEYAYYLEFGTDKMKAVRMCRDNTARVKKLLERGDA